MNDLEPMIKKVQFAVRGLLRPLPLKEPDLPSTDYTDYTD
jgi:hypothetical protein